MKNYIDELERMGNVTKGVSGIYNDPEDENRVIVQSDELLFSMDKEAWSKLKETIDKI